MPLPHPIGTFPKIQGLNVKQVGSDDLTEVLQNLKVSGCSLGGFWYPNDL